MGIDREKDVEIREGRVVYEEAEAEAEEKEEEAEE